jgi:predicted AAA+ superfamily ATPase
VRRLAGQGGDPVVQLQTNFGGGKTHSMLALYHLFGGAAPGELAGVDSVLAEAGVKALPKAKRVVLVGNKISPGNPVTKADGTVVRTLWGELAYQLGGAKAFARIAKDDEQATSPGDVLRELFVEHGLASYSSTSGWPMHVSYTIKAISRRAVSRRSSPSPRC